MTLELLQEAAESMGNVLTSAEIIAQATWHADCMKYRGEVLTGEYSHWCNDWDGLPMDETCGEWPCACAREMYWQRRPNVIGILGV